MPFPCWARVVPLPCRAAKGLECVFPIWFTQCGRVWFTLAMPCSDHAVLLKITAQHGRAVLWPWEERHGHGMTSVNQTQMHCVNQMGKTHSKPLAAWGQHDMCESAFRLLDPVDESTMILRKVDNYSIDTAYHSRRIENLKNGQSNVEKNCSLNIRLIQKLTF